MGDGAHSPFYGSVRNRPARSRVSPDRNTAFELPACTNEVLVSMKPGVATILALAVAACGGNAPPVPIDGESRDALSLIGIWTGEFRSEETAARAASTSGSMRNATPRPAMSS